MQNYNFVGKKIVGQSIGKRGDCIKPFIRFEFDDGTWMEVEFFHGEGFCKVGDFNDESETPFFIFNE